MEREHRVRDEKTFTIDSRESKLMVSGLFGYSHFTGGFAGGQAEYVRVPHADMNLLGLPDDVPDERGLYLSDVLSTSWHCVVDTGINKDDVVAVWGAGPIGQMVVEFSFYHGASRVILVDGGDASWRLDLVKSKIPRVELLDFTKLPKGESVTSQLKKMVDHGPDVALDCTSGEYAKGWAHYFETLLGMETDTSEMLNEMITALRPFGRIGVTGIYAGYVSNPILSFVRECPANHLPDKSLQHRRHNANRNPINRQRPSPSPPILGAFARSRSTQGN